MKERTMEHSEGEGTTFLGSPLTEGERSETERSGDPKNVARHNTRPPDPEVPAKATRRRFSAKYKLRILAEIDACKGKGEVGALLRRESLYSSNVSQWRRQRDSGILSAMEPKKRGRKAHPVNPLAKRIAAVERENERLKKKLQQAETIIDFQKKLSEMLGLTLTKPEDEEKP